jgi:acyl-CoA dehydrogenase
MDVLQVDKPACMADEEFTLLADSAGRFFDRHATPDDIKRWEEAGVVDRDLWFKAGEAGLLGVSVPTEYGGAGGDFRHEAVIAETMGHRGLEAFGLTLHNAIVAPYVTAYGSEAQKRRWLPKICTGELVTAIAMTEPGAGSDLQGVRTTARRDGDGYVINGQKTFITNGQTANLICVVAKTDPAQGSRGTSLVFVETAQAEGFRRGRNLDKIGLKGQDTSELFFDDVRAPAENLLGESEGQGFYQLMQKLPQERHLIALQALAMTERALKVTIDYVKQRKAFGKALLDFQNTQFKLAECKTEATIAKVFVNHCTSLLVEGRLDAATASMAKYWVTDLQGKIIDECLQLFGGYGYMNEYPIAQMFRDARVQRIYGGANEIMKVLIARTL